ncbi:MAG TPA: heat-inducible transcriptional repressor HrcA [Gaiellaceae bacterium]|nr:heat-inducible transcriptional repressor HrcA [Gaiellaceae bacterium]HZU20421.1 heat-inducible transcriptional repressor HrcA [Gaiellaceae bacterium]
MEVALSVRQRELLQHVVEEYVSTGQPVGSKTLVRRAELTVSPSTVRGELAELERSGLLTHPHTSAGRVPTERGYRVYVDELLSRPDVRPGAFPLALGAARTEIDEALRATSEMLSQVTRLLALVSAPRIETATVRHVEALLLQPDVVMVVVILSTGSVSKLAFTFAEPVDPGLVTWAGDYLNDQLEGVRPGSRTLRRVFEEPTLGERERVFLQAIRGVFAEPVADDRQVFVGGTAGLLEELRTEEIGAYRSLLEALEKRVALLDVLAQQLDPRRTFARVGEELEQPSLRDLALVGATYGLAHQTLGAVSLVGPLRMDYEKALRSVRAAAHELSRFVSEAYEDD